MFYLSIKPDNIKLNTIKLHIDNEYFYPLPSNVNSMTQYAQMADGTYYPVKDSSGLEMRTDYVDFTVLSNKVLFKKEITANGDVKKIFPCIGIRDDNHFTKNMPVIDICEYLDSNSTNLPQIVSAALTEIC